MGRSSRSRKRRDIVAKRSLPLSYSRRLRDRKRAEARSRSRSPLLLSPRAFGARLELAPYRATRKAFTVTPVLHSPNVNRKVDRSVRFRPAQLPTKSVKTVCESRKERKQVMFASGRAGRKGQRTPIWTKQSKLRCK